MKLSLNVGRIAGVRLSIHWTFIFILIWIFMRSYRSTGSVADATWGVLFIIAVFFCVVLHEFGHILTARRYGIKTSSIKILPIGGLANMERMPDKPSQELAVALAGPAVNVVIAALLYAALYITGETPSLLRLPDNVTPDSFLAYLLAANVALAVFNLIPAFPMDGGRVLRAILGFYMDNTRATVIAARIGQLMAMGFVLYGMINGSIWLILIGAFVFFGAEMEANYSTTRAFLSEFRVREAVMRNYTLLRAEDTVDVAAQAMLNGSETNFLIADNGRPAGFITRDDIVESLADRGKDTRLREVMKTEFPVLELDMSLEEAYQQLATKKTQFGAVVSGQNLEGTLDIENIKEFILTKAAAGKER